MRKIMSCLAIAVLFILSACGVETTTPNRLVGHWKVEAGTRAEYYFSPIDADIITKK